MVLEISIRTDKIFKYFVNLSKQKWRLVGHFKFYPDETSQDSWEDCNKCMCKVSEKMIFIWTDKSRTDGRKDGRTDGAQINIPHKKNTF